MLTPIIDTNLLNINYLGDIEMRKHSKALPPISLSKVLFTQKFLRAKTVFSFAGLREAKL